ncbi:hypothetical protein [Paenibacillus sp. Mc5Re-14]|uniref:hypothetical protein n=1 Tax=Paenibacillus sp. Mc5Re-14 TaxID=1030529 RepID=UPI000A7FFF4B|nr:hypothetical protein [Paenibacillus sp. Mc5Re-14]
MKLNKKFFESTFDSTKRMFESKMMKIPHEVIIKFQSKEDYLVAVKENPLIQTQINLGFYKDIEKEYVGFAVVYANDKLELRTIMGLPYAITICDEIAKDVLKPFTSTEIKAYLTHVYLHELTHIFDNKLKETFPDMWQENLSKTNQNVPMANELFAESIPPIVMGEKDISIYKSVEKKLWSKVILRAEQAKRQRRL